ncbi:MAG: flagellar basal body L-ring protein FlgH [Calditrichaeota bacterium]|nr:MAG: flagellar basal body L-ring protein FlgH [Calditrichota bacterium]
MKTKTFALVVLAWFGVVSLCFGQTFDNYKRQSLYTDFKAKTVGDIVTILIVESTSGSQQSNVSSTDKASVKASGSVTGNLTSFLPILGASSDFESDNSAKGGSAQQDVLTGKMTAVVTHVLPSGNLVLQGKRRLEVNGERYILEVKGVVRQKDISADNVVFSYNVANVEISYKKDGFFNKLGKPGLLARWSTYMMLVGLGAAAYLGVSAAQ